MKIEHYKYYWDKPILKQMLEDVINLAQEDFRVDIDNTKEKTLRPFLDRDEIIGTYLFNKLNLKHMQNILVVRLVYKGEIQIERGLERGRRIGVLESLFKYKLCCE